MKAVPRELVERLEKVARICGHCGYRGWNDGVTRCPNDALHSDFQPDYPALAAEALAWVEEQMPPVRLNPDRKTPPSNVFRAGYVAALDDVRAALEFKEDHPDDPS